MAGCELSLEFMLTALRRGRALHVFSFRGFDVTNVQVRANTLDATPGMGWGWDGVLLGKESL